MARFLIDDFLTGEELDNVFIDYDEEEETRRDYNMEVRLNH